jgi:hypothetical protein
LPLGLDLSGSRAKIARANEHLEALQCEVKAINEKRNPYRIRLDRDGNSSTYSLVLVGGEFREPRLGVILGDAVHNLRSALDYIVVALVEKCRVTLTTRHQFPIFSDARNYLAKAPDMLAGITFALSDIAAFQPFTQLTPRYDPLFVIGYFSNADKHRIISDYVPIMESWDRAFIKPVPISVQQFAPPNYLRPQQEFVAARLTFAKPINLIEIDFRSEITVSPYFGTPAFGKVTKGLGAPTGFFKHASKHIAMIVDAFEAL